MGLRIAESPHGGRVLANGIFWVNVPTKERGSDAVFKKVGVADRRKLGLSTQ